jgi:hypothetical protein
VRGGVLAQECAAPLEEFFRTQRAEPTVCHVIEADPHQKS